MEYPIFFDAKNSLKLFGLKNDFNFLSKLYSNQNLPKVLMLSGNKGSGKSTLINHFFFSIFDPNNYDNKENQLSEESIFLKKFKNNLFDNIVYIQGSDFKSVKIDDVRNLKKKILQSSLINKDRFIIFDDIELFNHHSLNGLLKLIEEPTKNNYFFLIYNKSRPLLDTIKSRALEIKIMLKEKERLEVIDHLKNNHKLEIILDPESSMLTPGNFVKFNYICTEYNILPTGDFLANMKLLLNLYKKEKNSLYINFIFFLVDYYLNKLKRENVLRNDKIYEIRNYIFTNLNNFILYNINQNIFINTVKSKLQNE